MAYTKPGPKAARVRTCGVLDRFSTGVACKCCAHERERAVREGQTALREAAAERGSLTSSKLDGKTQEGKKQAGHGSA